MFLGEIDTPCLSAHLFFLGGGGLPDPKDDTKHSLKHKAIHSEIDVIKFLPSLLVKMICGLPEILKLSVWPT